MSSLFDRVDKAAAMMAALEELDVAYKPGASGWQRIHCPNQAAHAHGDRNPSCSLKLSIGYVNCHSCGFRGDFANVAMELFGMKVDEAVRHWNLDASEGKVEETYTWSGGEDDTGTFLSFS